MAISMIGIESQNIKEPKDVKHIGLEEDTLYNLILPIMTDGAAEIDAL